MSAKRNAKRFFRWVVFIGIIVVAFMTNPEKETHIDKINEKLYDLLPTGQKSSIIKDIGKLVSNQILEQLITVDNYYIFSVSKIEILGESETISYGAFGMVFFTDKIKDVDI